MSSSPSFVDLAKKSQPPVFRVEPKTHALVLFHYAFPIVLLVFFIVFLGAWSVYASPDTKEPLLKAHANGNGVNGKSPSKKKKPMLGSWTRSMFNWALVGLVITYILDSVNVIIHSLADKGWWCGQDVVISTVSMIFLTLMILISQLESEHYPGLPHAASWELIVVAEITILIQTVALYATDRHGWTKWQIAQVAIASFRILWGGLMVSLWFFLYYLYKRNENTKSEAGSDSSPLLQASESESQTDYGSTAAPVKDGDPAPPTDPNQPAGFYRRTTTPEGSWWEYLKGYAVFFPYLWPSTDRRLQAVMILCFALVLAQVGINALVPDQLGKVTDILGGENGEPRVPWLEITLYIVYRLLQGNMGILGALRSVLWIPIGQYSYRTLSTSAFEHVHSLSLDFHLGKKTGEVLSALSKGSSINNFLEMVTFQVLPMLLNLGVAVGYFLIKFDAYYALIVIVITGSYLYVTVRMAAWRADIRREMVNKSREEDAVKNDSMIAYETVKYFNAEAYEFNRYRGAVEAYQKAEYHVMISLNIMNVTQNLMFTAGLVVACYLSAYQVTSGKRKVGDFVTLLTYMTQLQGPLNFFGTFYRSIQSSMINSERMLELFKEQPTVTDSPDAKLLIACTGEIAFDDVHFSYDIRKPALTGLSFKAAPGTTTAFVGESGGGKTTILRLLFRFYNVNSGAIMIDGEDVREVTIESLREKIGVVPQDTVLFNETLLYNLKYANPNATDEEVYDACKAASIHDKILTFPDGYKTKVGERGLRLSGGEKQRVAIARTILKNPRIILLDEATASLDSETEQHIQSALKELTAGRTTLVIAHRLSTITNANQIVVVHEGRVSEVGTHDELLKKHGRYHSMWSKQIRAEQKMKKLEVEDDDSLSTGYNTPAVVVSEPEDGDSTVKPVVNTTGAPSASVGATSSDIGSGI